jgi:hypothetical protein
MSDKSTLTPPPQIRLENLQQALKSLREKTKKMDAQYQAMLKRKAAKNKAAEDTTPVNLHFPETGNL